MAGAFEIVMQERKALVDKIIGMMKQGDFFHNASEWDVGQSSTQAAEPIIEGVVSRRKPDETDGGRNGTGIPGSQMGNG